MHAPFSSHLSAHADDPMQAVAAWQSARQALAGPRGRINLGAAVDRFVAWSAPDQVALQVRYADGVCVDITYEHLADRTDRIARVLRQIGVEKGDRVFLLLERVPEFHLSMLGALKAGAVAAPLFPAFGPAPIATRIRVGRGGVLVTSARLYERKIAPMRDQLPELRAVLLVPDRGDNSNSHGLGGTLDLKALMAAKGAH